MIQRDVAHWSDAEGKRVPMGELPVGEDELLDPKGLRRVVPEEQYEGYTGNEGMTLDRWYRHAAVVLWPDRNHFDVLCDGGMTGAVRVLQQMEDRLWLTAKPQAAAPRAECVRSPPPSSRAGRTGPMPTTSARSDCAARRSRRRRCCRCWRRSASPPWSRTTSAVSWCAT